jgi:hypothetical protein
MPGKNCLMRMPLVNKAYTYLPAWLMLHRAKRRRSCRQKKLRPRVADCVGTAPVSDADPVAKTQDQCTDPHVFPDRTHIGEFFVPLPRHSIGEISMDGSASITKPANSDKGLCWQKRPRTWVADYVGRCRAALAVLPRRRKTSAQTLMYFRTEHIQVSL